jgi:hypothetical protein
MVAINKDSPTLLASILVHWMNLEGHKILTAAMCIGVDESTLCNWIMGRSLPNYDNIDRLALCMCVSGLKIPYYEARQLVADCVLFDKRHRRNRHESNNQRT